MTKLYNTLTREKEALPDQKKIRLFVCGPTVYDYLHIGNARTYIFFDFFAKYLRHIGYDVFYLQNITDIDDKIIKRAAEEQKKTPEIADFFTAAYMEDMRALGIDAVTEYAPATKFISQIAAQVERLIDKGYAYKIEGDGWYFDISEDTDYGKLSGRTAEQAEDGVSRIDEALGKRNKGDFCLWKFSKSDEPSWPSILGDGRPGWHIEDTAISEFYFGPQYDIHGGGVDLKFPHHEAEIAQQESASGLKPFVRTWVHTGALLVEGKKMSKSLGNFVTIRDFLDRHPAELLRWMTLTHHYRSPLDYSEANARQAQAGINTVLQFVAKLGVAEGAQEKKTPSHVVRTIVEQNKEMFSAALSDDLNTPGAIAAVFSLISEYQDTVWRLAASDATMLKEYIKGALDVLGLSSLNIPAIPQKIQQMAQKREEFRSNKQFIQSDALRDEMDSLGYEIEDTPMGYFLWPKS
jgi:cysteinyl-tRNA synthetase